MAHLSNVRDTYNVPMLRSARRPNVNKRVSQCTCKKVDKINARDRTSRIKTFSTF